jgi:hypothetical protein
MHRFIICNNINGLRGQCELVKNREQFPPQPLIEPPRARAESARNPQEAI